MQELVAGVEKLRFDLEADVEQPQGAQPLPFLGTDSKLGTGCCSDSGSVRQPGARFPFRRIGGERMAVCRRWLRGLCEKGDGCEFPHESDAARVPQCCFCSQLGECSSEDCRSLHADATAGTVGCPWYDRGFCRQGPLCRYKHTRRVMCANYLVGFCPEGPKCKFMQYVR
ncbi:CPSF4 factor, partial [Syrrhaptes paradoxus]|nr:CPSF4 factor [Syrrhaptes paradoxus]